ncbi:DUF4271 domain-containing protein [Muriicola sp.]|uniref:DUF4271 domain-containing protein n=1 Tax=Muriicola sp. TaxID=2020856 RepID=UPI003C7806E5
MEPILREIGIEDWITLIIFSSVIFLVLAKSLFYGRFLNFIILPFNNKYIFLYNKKDRLMNWFHIFFAAFELLNVSLFSYLAITIYKPGEVLPSPILFTFILGLVFLFLFLKILVQLGNSTIFNNQSVIAEILFKKISYLNYGSLILFFTNVLLTYVFIGSKTVVVFGVIVFLLILAIGWVTIIKTHLKFLTSYFFYFILYLCALEIAPIIIIVNALKV